MDIKEVVDKLTGPIMPVADSAIDAERYKNLEEKILLADKLIDDIVFVSNEVNSSFSSKQKAGIRATRFLEELGDQLSTDFGG